MVGHVTATFVKESSVDTETLLRLRLHDCGKGARNESPSPSTPDSLCLQRMGGWGRVSEAGAVERLLTQVSGAVVGERVPSRCPALPCP